MHNISFLRQQVSDASSRRFPVVLLGGLLAAFAAPASAETNQLPFQGKYRIGIDATGVAPSAGQCLIRGNNRTGNFERFLWPLGGPALWCGFPTKDALVANGQAVFEVVKWADTGTYMLWQLGACLTAEPDGTTSVTDCDTALQTGRGLFRIDTSVRVGTTIYASIRANADNRCLIFSNNGYDLRPTLFNWGQPGGDPLYCGMSLDDLMRTGQGLFTFTEVVPPDHYTSVIRPY